VCFGCRSSNLILLDLTIALLLRLGTVTEVTEMRPPRAFKLTAPETEYAKEGCEVREKKAMQA